MDEFTWGVWVGIAVAINAAAWAWIVHRYFREGADRRADRRAVTTWPLSQMRAAEMLPMPNPAQENHRIWGDTVDRENLKPVEMSDFMLPCYILACDRERGHDGPHNHAKMDAQGIQ